MGNVLSQLWTTLPTADPFAGVLVWGSTGLAAYMLCAALVGIALGALHRLHAKAPATEAECAGREDWRDAA